MIKWLIFFFLIAIPALIFSQEIKSNEVDPFSNERSIETSIVSLKQGLTSGFGISYSAVGNSYYLNVIGYGKKATFMTDDDKLWFVLEDGNVIQFNNRAEVENENSEKENVYVLHYFGLLNDIEVLKNKRVALVRIASPENVINDLIISKSISKSFLKLNKIFFEEVNKN